VKEYLITLGWKVHDVGTCSEEACDYPDVGVRVAEEISKNKQAEGILICGTGVGMSIVANKFPGIRAALVHNTYVAQYAREHNNANVLVLPGRVIGKELALAIIDVWLKSKFSGERHQRRLDKITALEHRFQTQTK
jgi:ribose 5-phosphate isomerase B